MFSKNKKVYIYVKQDNQIYKAKMKKRKKVQKLFKSQMYRFVYR